METILITGSTGLLGEEFVNYFLSKNMRVIAIYRNEEKFNSMFAKNPNLYGIQSDFREEDAASKIINGLEKLDIFPEYLVNVASGGDSFKVSECGFSERDDMIETYVVNVIAPYEISFKIANHEDSKLKKIINLSSMYGIVPYNPNLYNNPLTESPIQYSVSKAALIHLTKEMAIRFADKNIMVNCISYGGVEGRANDEFKEKFAKVTPLKRMMKPKETIGALEYLISDNSAYMTGHNLVVDGGRTVW